ncbi:MAG: TonB-dependent receptor plug domain-containing protein [Acidobacteria bacterium]|nr:TonB-dependent receptor plug domain-containing protein [Acidobacteriota bacterium]
MVSITRAALVAALFASLLGAQANLATVTGIVTDAADAVIPGATVAILNTGTGVSREVQTGATGNYTVTSLQPGKYELTVVSEGFSTYTQRGIELLTGQTLRADVRLELGQVTETVTVDAQLVTLNTENGTIKGDVIVQEEIQELPLAGRDFTDLAFFTPGVVPKAEGGQGSGLAVNGARASNTNFYVDGFDNRNARGAAAQVRPNIDALQEFKMEVSGYSAEYGRMAGGVMNMALRSGTNEFHGNINYFLRNDINDARGFFERDKIRLRQNQFAVTVAGPIVKNKTFFLVSFEGMRRIQDSTKLTRVPSLMERDGDFSQSLNTGGAALYLRDRLASGACNANNQKSCFANNFVPLSRRDPIGMTLATTYPVPNRDVGPTGFNYFTVAPDVDNWNSPLFKIDHKLGENNLAFRWQTRYNDTQNPFAGSDTGQFGLFTKDDRSLAGIDYTHMFSPSLLFEVRFGYARNATWQEGRNAGQNISKELGLPDLIPEGEAKNEPGLLDWPQIFAGNNFSQLGPGANMPVQYFTTDWQYGAKMTWIKGKHNMKFGFNSNFVQMNQPYFNNQRGTYRFVGNRTGNSIADMELGWLNNVTRQVGFNRNYWRQHALGAFFNDDWKTTRKLTLNLGIRWEVNRAPWDKYDRLGSYDTDTLKLVIADDANAPANYQDLLDETGLRDVITTAGAVGRSRSVISTDWNNFTPRAGFAYRVNDKSVLRGGYGIFIAGDILNNLRNNLSNQFPFAINQNFVGVNGTPNLVSLQTPFPDARLTFSGTTTTNGFTMDPNQAYLQSWNMTIERQLPGGTALELDYRGSKGTFLQRRYDFNQPYRDLASYVSGQGFARPISQWNAINIFSASANSNYNAFNASWRKRSRGGLFWRLNYSWSKSIDTASQANGQSQGGFAQALDSRNLWLDRGRSDWDRRHVFTMIANSNLPFGRGRAIGSNWSGVTQTILGGWQLSGTMTMYTGSPMTIETTVPNLNLGGSARPNRIRDGAITNDAGVGKRGVDYPFYDLTAFEAVPCYVEDPTDVPTGCITQSSNGFSPFGFGNAGRNILDGPGLWSTDVALSKNFKIREGQNLQLRLETFNILNRANFIIQDDMTFFDGIAGGLLSQVGQVGRGGGPRIFQYALKYRF